MAASIEGIIAFCKRCNRKSFFLKLRRTAKQGKRILQLYKCFACNAELGVEVKDEPRNKIS